MYRREFFFSATWFFSLLCSLYFITMFDLTDAQILTHPHEMYRVTDSLRGDRMKYFSEMKVIFRRCDFYFDVVFCTLTLISSFATQYSLSKWLWITASRDRLEWINGTWSHLPWHVMQTRVKERRTIFLNEKGEADGESVVHRPPISLERERYYIGRE